MPDAVCTLEDMDDNSHMQESNGNLWLFVVRDPCKASQKTALRVQTSHLIVKVLLEVLGNEVHPRNQVHIVISAHDMSMSQLKLLPE